MRNEKEILEYLVLPREAQDTTDVEAIIEVALTVEEKYTHELYSGKYGYALCGDFYTIPHIIEDTGIYNLCLVEAIDSIIVYKKQKYN